MYFCCDVIKFVMNTVYLSIGSNMGDRLDYLSKANKLIRQRIGNIIKESSIYETEPWGFLSDDLFLNQVVIADSPHSPTDILNEVKTIEKYIGRNQILTKEYASRVMDIDILFYNDLIFESQHLTFPHLHLHKRNFVLVPLCEISPEFIHPVFQIELSQLLINCPDRSNVNIYH